jgi:glutathione-regulated potassium-efflux system ancillary protein KefG
MPSVLLLFAHPALDKSRVNTVLLRHAHALDKVWVHDLYEHYPEFDIDVGFEQELLSRHDVILFHHPFYWYSAPAMLQEWKDLVLAHGWAYGRTGRALEGKQLGSVISAGGSEAVYLDNPPLGCSLPELLSPVMRTARHCFMEYIPPFMVFGTHRITEPEIHQQGALFQHYLQALTEGNIDFATARQYSTINQRLDRR